MHGKSRKLALAVVALIILFAVYMMGRGTGSETAREEERLENGIAASRVVEFAFDEQSKFVVAQASGTVSATSEDRGRFGWLRSNQRMIAPFTSTYTVDLKGVDAADMRWEEQSKTLFVELPGVTVEPVNVDEARKQTSRRGIWVTERASAALEKQGSAAAQAVAQKKASEPEFIRQAEDGARTRVGNFLKAPLQAAGLRNVRVVVRFPADGRRSDERWDRSRPMKKVLEEQRTAG
jgi:hypothetical protein